MAILDRLKKKSSEAAAKPAADSATKKKVAAKQPAKRKAGKGQKAAEKKGRKGEAKKAKKGVATGSAYRILVEPLVTEKATLTGTYYFRVDPRANKTEVAKAIKQVYEVTPKHVRVMNVRGKKVRAGQRNEGTRSDWKKAIVRLNEGDSINVYEGT